MAGKSGAANITAFDISRYPTRFGCEVRNFEPSEFMELKDTKRTDRTVHLAMCAARQAMAGVSLDGLDRNRIGVVIGSGIGGIYTFERQHTILMERGPDKVSPFFILNRRLYATLSSRPEPNPQRASTRRLLAWHTAVTISVCTRSR